MVNIGEVSSNAMRQLEVIWFTNVLKVQMHIIFIDRALERGKKALTLSSSNKLFFHASIFTDNIKGHNSFRDTIILMHNFILTRAM